MHVTFELVAERISITSGTPVESLRPDTMVKDLALDSFLLVEMAVDLQEEFDAIFTQEDLQRVAIIADLVDLLNVSQAEYLRASSARAAGAAPASPTPAAVTHG